MSRVTVGRLGRPHGNAGEMALDSASLSTSELLAIRTFTWRNARGEERTVQLASARSALPRPLVRFEGVGHRDQAAELVNGELWVDANQLPDPGPGVAYAFQLVGLEVREDSGRVLGRLDEILSTGAHPVYIVHGEREWLLPATSEVVRRVDLEAGVITVTLPAGLEEV